MMKKLLTASTIAALALSLAACSGTSEEDAVIAAAESFMNGMIAGDGETVCGLSLREGEIVTSDDPDWSACVDSIAILSDTLAPQLEAEGITEVTIDKATVTGDTATIAVEDINGDIFHGQTSVFALRKIEGKWYLDSPS
ncbi:hypothetical protein ACQUSY_03395 [Microbacterium sp. YY-03]|uniref:hypothetical protein n=1 Tax=Microbacterium sp. YY-03 TaxID=3421636 RepID=UPI003D185033